MLWLGNWVACGEKLTSCKIELVTFSEIMNSNSFSFEVASFRIGGRSSISNPYSLRCKSNTNIVFEVETRLFIDAHSKALVHILYCWDQPCQTWSSIEVGIRNNIIEYETKARHLPSVIVIKQASCSITNIVNARSIHCTVCYLFRSQSIRSGKI